MKKLVLGDPETESTDLVAENIARLKTLFPELLTEGSDGAAVNVDVLKSLVGDAAVRLKKKLRRSPRISRRGNAPSAEAIYSRMRKINRACIGC
jgi:hypothetical protein